MEDHLQHVKAGDRVVCIGNSGYGYLLTENKEYTVVRYEPAEQSDLANYRRPAYMVVLGDSGQPVHAHAHRFRLPVARRCTGLCGAYCLPPAKPDPLRKFRLPRGWRAHNFIGPFMPY